jgi:hypothetical protein
MPAQSWKAFFNQRIRWASKADKYDDKRIFLVLLLVYLLNSCLLAMLLISGFVNKLWLFASLGLILVKYILEFSFVKKLADFFGMKRMLLPLLLMQPLHVIYTVIAGFLGKFGSYNWKGRKVK